MAVVKRIRISPWKSITIINFHKTNLAYVYILKTVLKQFFIVFYGCDMGIKRRWMGKKIRSLFSFFVGKFHIREQG